MLNLTMDEVPQQPPKRAALVQLGKAAVSQVMILELLRLMELGGRLDEFQWDNDGEWLRASDGRVTIEANELSGGIRYRLRPLDEERRTDILTSETSLERIARDFVNMIGRPQEPMTLQKVTYLRSIAGTSDGDVMDEVKLDAGLIFERMVGDIPVIGPGGMVMVKIGTDDAVVGGREIWRPVVGRGAPVNLRSPEEAAKLLQGRLSKLGLDGEAHVRKARFGYAELGMEEEQLLLEPCYAYVVESVGSGPHYKKVETIPAAHVGPMADAFAAA